ncbi:MAG TPA: TAT-variant-translocated molybdopterin oxidoreductase, partial [Saprospiraceae bacterium]|nr:TAT-variant-translocated molybdopterin oxidoreductase [Saprospiraceae bacterium]
MSEFDQGYWGSSEEFTNDEAFVKGLHDEFYELPILNNMSKEEDESAKGHNRRDFLKYLGFSIGAATIAASCETPVRKALPYVKMPDSIVPGVANYYASTFIKGNDVLPVVVKTREGRPIKIEGNTLSSFSGGGTSARAQASVLDLYDTGRYKFAGKSDGKGGIKKMKWSELDKAVMDKLASGGNIRIVSNSITSPSMNAVINQFITAYPTAKHVTYDPYSSSAT